ncbi:MAG: CocE/NonD family hydrolase [Alphaproteobacteria bacterium]
MAQQLAVDMAVPVAMRDGTTLLADVYRPAAPGRYPVILLRTPYNRRLPTLAYLQLDPVRAAERGYALVIQDTRGRFASEGEFYCFADEGKDGYDTIEWAAKQPWSDGKVGMYGASYMGAVQWLAAIERPPHLRCIAPLITASDYHEGWAYQGGAFQLGFNLSWTVTTLVLANLAHFKLSESDRNAVRAELIEATDHMSRPFADLPLRDLPVLKRLNLAKYYFDWLDHADDDDYWRRWNIEDRYPEITVPALNIGGWYDIFLGGTLRNYLGMRAKGPSAEARTQRLIVGPWLHSTQWPNVVGEHDFGVRSMGLALDLDGLLLRWFDHWLKGNDTGLMAEAPVKLFVMGENVWRDEQAWPLARAKATPYYFHSAGSANSLDGDGRLSIEAPADEPSDHYVYDPKDPVPTRGGALCCWTAALPSGAYDQREVERRRDVLVYTSQPLERAIEVTGPVTVKLWAASSARDTDFTAKLVDVAPDGYARNLTDGIIRARYRTTTKTGTLIEPGKVYEYEIDLWATSNVFLPGHRIRVEIASSNFPRFDRNSNTGGSFGRESAMESARQTVFHDGTRPSHIVLPVVPR